MSSETRLVRPYEVGSEFQRALDSCALQSAGEATAGGGDVGVSLDDYLNFPISLDLRDIPWDELKSGAAALGIDHGDIDLLILAASPRLRFVDVVHKQALNDEAEIPRIISLTQPERPRALQGPHGGADIRLYFCLNKSLKPSELRPWRKGTWLGQIEFRLRSDLSGSGFVPIRMTDEDRENFGLPSGTMRYVDLDDVDPFDREPSRDALKLYIDADLMDRLHMSSSTPVAKYVQKQLFVDSTSAILFAAHKRLAEDPQLRGQSIEDFRGSLVHKLTELLSTKSTGQDGVQQRQIEFQRICNNPTQVLALVEAKAMVRSDMLNAFGEAQ